MYKSSINMIGFCDLGNPTTVTLWYYFSLQDAQSILNGIFLISSDSFILHKIVSFSCSD